MNKKQTIGIFGSAFNPPHFGHLDAIEQVLDKFDRLIVVPSYRHAFGKQMAPYSIRFRMTEALVNEIQTGTPIQVSRIEETLARNQLATNYTRPIYTYDVLTALAQKCPGAELYFIVGPDNADAKTWQKFYRANEILTQWNICPVKERKAVRSTRLRHAITNGDTIIDWLPESVAKIVMSHQLYMEQTI